ncbi:hypothetical protein NPX13_g7455 [Xylaria arbuscula]|uniref:Uncharacterized protein n=1 Tax=Xylaria arbuscula TaxID=114810 RepID=A0A9W8NAM6_9PEZI|nr:hypothetical protein NPX13_g7455 [Xylaria arbuscula]
MAAGAADSGRAVLLTRQEHHARLEYKNQQLYWQWRCDKGWGILVAIKAATCARTARPIAGGQAQDDDVWGRPSTVLNSAAPQQT